MSRYELTFRPSSACSMGNCVEVASLPGGGAAMRDSKDPDGPVLVFTADEWSAFLAGVRAGEFDGPVLAESMAEQREVA